MGGTWPNDHEANPDTGVCLSRLRVLQNKAHTRKNVSEGEQNKVGSQGLVHVKGWKGGGGTWSRHVRSLVEGEQA